ncbi:Ig-like domain-containing protein [Comamonas sp.]|uniref:Ig-like domain-containing protein n=1 Tax=Comamonas sp. TaxID=34028 RepID=UPI0028A994B9|nr:Ig-like domain-containing protein [Comamonas sp.]
MLASLAGAVANAQTVIFHEDFGNSANRVSSPYVPRVNLSADPGYYTSRASGAVPDGTYTIMRPQSVRSSTASSYWRDLAQDHTFELTGETGGALMVLNAGSGLDSFYQRNFDVQPGGSYRISVWRYTVNNNLGNGQPVSWSLRLQEVNSGTDIINSGAINSQARYVWEESVYEFSVPPTCVPPVGGIQTKLSLRNESPVTNGNDIYIDDISVTQISYDPTLPSACPVERSAVIAGDDATTTPLNTSVNVSVKGNDSTSAGVLGNPVITTPPVQGTALVNPDGTIAYTPPTGFTGEVTFEYEICNGETQKACDKAIVTITVEAPLPVVADDDSASTKANTPVKIDVKVNDSTPVGVLGNPSIVSQPASGEATVNPDGTITYTPPAGFAGVVTFEYEICNGQTPQSCDKAVVTVTVEAPVAALPVIAEDDTASTKVNTPVTVDVKSNDSTPAGVLGNPTIVMPPSNGNAIVNPDGTITFTPADGFTGDAAFEYEICNGETPQACDRAVVTVTVTADPVVPPVQAATPVPAMGFGALVALSGVIGAVGISRRRKKNS